MKKYILPIILLGIGLIGLGISLDTSNEKALITGKNNITFSENFNEIYVRDFIKIYPQIEAISNNEGQETKGYINYLQGIGENFILKPTKQYEIITSENVSIII